MTRNTSTSSDGAATKRKLILGGETTYVCEVDNSFDLVSI